MEIPFLIVGLGNPGPQYEATRHNIGAMLLYNLGDAFRIQRFRSRFKGAFADKRLQGRSIALLFPHTYMNLSGESVAAAVTRLGVPLENLVILHDDVDLPFGTIKVKKSGGPGGHNGLKSLIDHLGTREFVRLRLGIGRPEGDMIKHVLGPFEAEQIEKLSEIFEKSTTIVEAILNKGATYAMNAFNGAGR